MVYKFYGAKAGVLLGGVLGGLISSTASTLTYATDTRQNPNGNAGASVMIMIASTVVFARVLAEVAVVTPGSFTALAPPLFVMMVGMVGHHRLHVRARQGSPPPHLLRTNRRRVSRPRSPSGLLYAVVLIAVAVARSASTTPASTSSPSCRD